jgi:hypothetical protein
MNLFRPRDGAVALVLCFLGPGHGKCRLISTYFVCVELCAGRTALSLYRIRESSNLLEPRTSSPSSTIGIPVRAEVAELLRS